MGPLRLTSRLALLAVASALLLPGGASARGPRVEATRAIPISALPPEARETIALIRAGGPFPFRKDGAIFSNRERRLPRRARGYYREYTVPTPGSHDRGPRRIIAGAEGELWYTADHYRTFVRVEAPP